MSMKAALDFGAHAGAFSRDHGGRDWSLLEAVQHTERLSAANPSVALMLVMPMGLAGVLREGQDVAPAPHRQASRDQLDRIAADYHRGAIYAACNSERGAGGSLAATKTEARRSPGGGYLITGEKILASSGSKAARFFSTARISQEDLPGAGVVEFFLVDTTAPGVEILDDWDGFGMRPTESNSVRYVDAPSDEIVGYPNFIEILQPLQYFFCLFSAIPLGCAAAILHELATPAPASAALRLRFSSALTRIEAMRAYLHETAAAWRPAAGPAYAARVMRTKAYVTEESAKLSAELFALSGGRHYRRGSPVARRLADSFAGAALRPPLPLALDAMVEQFDAAGLP
jgi:alkylation response protein AidB-like acyl-CoA dehydrogenase